jgi:ribosomal protein L19E
MTEPAAADAGTSTAQRQEAARKNLESAEQRLQEAKVVGPGDRKGTASGGSRLTPQYIQRVQEAEQEVEQARQELQESGVNP